MQWIFVLCGCLCLLSLRATYQVCTVSLKAGLYTYKALELTAKTLARFARSSPPACVPCYDYARQTMNELPYAKWREYDPEDTVRFYALRLHEAGMIKSTPQKIIAQGIDWRFLNALKKEMKG